jgi:putative ABC transport system permease protein
LPDRRWRKVVRDLWLHRSRTLVVALAIAVSLAGAGTILNTWALVERATREGFDASNPPAATLWTDAVDDGLLEAIRAHPAVADAQARRTSAVAIQVQGSYRAALLFATADFPDVRIGRLQPEVGAWPPVDGAIVIERSSVEFAGTSIGEPVRLVAGSGDAAALPVTGIVRDVGLAPGWMEHVVYGFVTPATLASLGLPSTPNEVRIVVRDHAATRDDVRRIVGELRTLIEKAGHPVTDVDVPVPGEHIHAAQMDSLLYTQGAFGLLALVVSALLIVNLIAAMLAGQVREIGVMKTLGGGLGQLGGMYLATAMVLGLLATAVAVPASVLVGREYAALKAELLNFPVHDVAIPWWAVALQIIVGLSLPVIAAALPVVRGIRIPVAEALRDHGISADARVGTTALAGRRWLSRPTLLSIRNAFRQRQRMILTLLALATGGAVYLGARNLRQSVIGSLDLVYGPMQYDFTIRLAEPHPVDSIEAVVRGVAGVRAAEAWAGARATVAHADGAAGNAFVIQAPPARTALLRPLIIQGAWLPDGGNALVVNRRLLANEPSLQVGSTAMLMLNGLRTEWRIAGVVESGPSPVAYAARSALLAMLGSRKAATVAIDGDDLGPAAQVDLIRRVRGALDGAGLGVASSQLLEESRRVTEDHLLMVVQFLAVMGWVMILVGGMGLASTMSLAVLERRREIGVMRAIGAGHGAIASLIQAEGLVVALLSWLVALPLSIPMSVVLGEAFGRVMLPVPLILVPEAAGMLRWLGVVVVASVLACAWPARRAMRVPVASALAYE